MASRISESRHTIDDQYLSVEASNERNQNYEEALRDYRREEAALLEKFWGFLGEFDPHLENARQKLLESEESKKKWETYLFGMHGVHMVDWINPLVQVAGHAAEAYLQTKAKISAEDLKKAEAIYNQLLSDQSGVLEGFNEARNRLQKELRVIEKKQLFNDNLYLRNAERELDPTARQKHTEQIQSEHVQPAMRLRQRTLDNIEMGINRCSRLYEEAVLSREAKYDPATTVVKLASYEAEKIKLKCDREKLKRELEEYQRLDTLCGCVIEASKDQIKEEAQFLNEYSDERIAEQMQRIEDCSGAYSKLKSLFSKDNYELAKKCLSKGKAMFDEFSQLRNVRRREDKEEKDLIKGYEAFEECFNIKLSHPQVERMDWTHAQLQVSTASVSMRLEECHKFFTTYLEELKILRERHAEWNKLKDSNDNLKERVKESNREVLSSLRRHQRHWESAGSFLLSLQTIVGVTADVTHDPVLVGAKEALTYIGEGFSLLRSLSCRSYKSIQRQHEAAANSINWTTQITTWRSEKCEQAINSLYMMIVHNPEIVLNPNERINKLKEIDDDLTKQRNKLQEQKEALNTEIEQLEKELSEAENNAIKSKNKESKAPNKHARQKKRKKTSKAQTKEAELRTKLTEKKAERDDLEDREKRVNEDLKKAEQTLKVEERSVHLSDFSFRWMLSYIGDPENLSEEDKMRRAYALKVHNTLKDIEEVIRATHVPIERFVGSCDTLGKELSLLGFTDKFPLSVQLLGNFNQWHARWEKLEVCGLSFYASLKEHDFSLHETLKSIGYLQFVGEFVTSAIDFLGASLGVMRLVKLLSSGGGQPPSLISEVASLTNNHFKHFVLPHLEQIKDLIEEIRKEDDILLVAINDVFEEVLKSQNEILRAIEETEERIKQELKETKYNEYVTEIKEAASNLQADANSYLRDPTSVPNFPGDLSRLAQQLHEDFRNGVLIGNSAAVGSREGRPLIPLNETYRHPEMFLGLFSWKLGLNTPLPNFYLYRAVHNCFERTRTHLNPRLVLLIERELDPYANIVEEINGAIRVLYAQLSQKKISHVHEKVLVHRQLLNRKNRYLKSLDERAKVTIETFQKKECLGSARFSITRAFTSPLNVIFESSSKNLSTRIEAVLWKRLSDKLRKEVLFQRPCRYDEYLIFKISKQFTNLLFLPVKAPLSLLVNPLLHYFDEKKVKKNTDLEMNRISDLFQQQLNNFIPESMENLTFPYMQFSDQILDVEYRVRVSLNKHTRQLQNNWEFVQYKSTMREGPLAFQSEDRRYIQTVNSRMYEVERLDVHDTHSIEKTEKVTRLFECRIALFRERGTSVSINPEIIRDSDIGTLSDPQILPDYDDKLRNLLDNFLEIIEAHRVDSCNPLCHLLTDGVKVHAHHPNLLPLYFPKILMGVLKDRICVLRKILKTTNVGKLIPMYTFEKDRNRMYKLKICFDLLPLAEGEAKPFCKFIVAEFDEMTVESFCSFNSDHPHLNEMLVQAFYCKDYPLGLPGPQTRYSGYHGKTLLPVEDPSYQGLYEHWKNSGGRRLVHRCTHGTRALPLLYPEHPPESSEDLKKIREGIKSYHKKNQDIEDLEDIMRALSYLNPSQFLSEKKVHSLPEERFVSSASTS